LQQAETDPSLYVSRNEAFHLSLYEPAARPQLFDMIAMLHGRGERYLRLKFGLPSYKAKSDREHAALLDSVRRGDVAQAQSLVTKHLLRHRRTAPSVPLPRCRSCSRSSA
jgi:DNA-binding GntR family transcriptional regulator